MRRVIFADRSRGYLAALAGRAEAGGIRAEFELYTDKVRLAERLRSAPCHCLFADESFSDAVPEMSEDRVTWLVSEKEAAGANAIFKFQPAAELVRLIKDRVNLPALSETCVNVLIAAPPENEPADLFASFLARKLSENGSVLYLNTDAFSPGFLPEEDRDVLSLSELIYRQAGGAAAGKPAGGRADGVCYYAPPAFPEEETELRAMSVYAMAGRLFPKEFRSVVVRHTLGFADACRLIPQSDAVYFLEEPSEYGRKVSERRRQALAERFSEEICRRVRQLPVPEALPEREDAASWQRLYEGEWKEFLWNRVREIW